MKDEEVYAGKTLGNLLAEVHHNSSERRDLLIKFITDLGKNATTDPLVYIPMIKDLLDVLIRSDEHPLKIASIAQRSLAAEAGKNTGPGFLLTDDEIAKLMNTDASVATDIKDITDKVALLTSGSSTP
jgi:hypothetical protein